MLNLDLVLFALPLSLAIYTVVTSSESKDSLSNARIRVELFVIWLSNTAFCAIKIRLKHEDDDIPKTL